MKLSTDRIAIVALGPSWMEYVGYAEACGGRKNAYDQVWSINSGGGVIESDVVFHMDDLRVQEKRAAAGNVKIGNMLTWMRESNIPLMTSTAYPEYPAAIEFPLEEVVHKTGVAYFNSTPAYAIAYALYIGAKKISLYGLDYNWAGASEVEPGRACAEFWIAMAMSRGVEVFVAKGSTLLDQNKEHSFYGYDGRKVLMQAVDGKLKFEFGEIELPSAEEMEARYDHGATRGDN